MSESFNKAYNDRNINEKSLTEQAIDLINQVQQESVLHEVALHNLVLLADEVSLMIELTTETIEKEKEGHRS